MVKYEILWVADEKNRRDYRDRQLFANAKGAGIYVEGHHNANLYRVDVDGDGVKDEDLPGFADNPSSVLVCDNSGQETREMADYFSSECSRAFGIPNKGVVVLKKGDRAYYNLFYTKMPAVLLEPLYISDGEMALIAQTDYARDTIAQIITNMVRKFLPEGGVVAFSRGHVFKATSKWDRGAPVVNTQGRVAEADLVGEYMQKAAELLTSGTNISDAPFDVLEDCEAV